MSCCVYEHERLCASACARSDASASVPEWPLDLQVLPDLRKCEWATREYWINRGMCHDPLGFYPKFAKVGPWIVKLPKRRRTDESDPNDQTDGQPDNSEPAESSELVESSEPVTHWHGM